MRHLEFYETLRLSRPERLFLESDNTVCILAACLSVSVRLLGARSREGPALWICTQHFVTRVREPEPSPATGFVQRIFPRRSGHFCQAIVHLEKLEAEEIGGKNFDITFQDCYVGLRIRRVAETLSR